jgi:hypothetical protein
MLFRGLTLSIDDFTLEIFHEKILSSVSHSRPAAAHAALKIVLFITADINCFRFFFGVKNGSEFIDFFAQKLN